MDGDVLTEAQCESEGDAVPELENDDDGVRREDAVYETVPVIVPDVDAEGETVTLKVDDAQPLFVRDTVGVVVRDSVPVDEKVELTVEVSDGEFVPEMVYVTDGVSVDEML